MKLNRRQAMGAAMAGAAAAASGEAKQLMANQQYNLNPPIQMMNKFDEPQAMMRSEQELLREIAQTQEIANGNLLQWMLEEAEHETKRMGRNASDMGYNNMKSVSSPIKMMWEQERNNKRRRKEFINDAKKRLVSLLKEKASRGILG